MRSSSIRSRRFDGVVPYLGGESQMNEMVLRVVLMVPLLWLAALVIWLLIHYDSKGTFHDKR